MLAKKFSLTDSQPPARPLNACSPLRSDAQQVLHLMLVRAPSPTPRSLAWARRGGAQTYDSKRLEVMLRHERLNQG